MLLCIYKKYWLLEAKDFPVTKEQIAHGKWCDIFNFVQQKNGMILILVYP